MNLLPSEYPSDVKITLRPYCLDDAPGTYQMVIESIPMLKPWMNWAHEGYTQEEAEAFIQFSIDGWALDRYFHFVVTDACDGALLGGTWLGNISPTYRLANLAYWVRSSRRGQGIAPRIARLVARWGIERLGLLRAEIVVALENSASLRVAEKCGAHREGVLRNRMPLPDRVHDGVMHSLVPSDFPDLAA